MFDINMYDLSDLSDLPNKVTHCNGEPEWCLMAQKIRNKINAFQ